MFSRQCGQRSYSNRCTLTRNHRGQHVDGDVSWTFLAPHRKCRSKYKSGPAVFHCNKPLGHEGFCRESPYMSVTWRSEDEHRRVRKDTPDPEPVQAPRTTPVYAEGTGEDPRTGLGPEPIRAWKVGRTNVLPDGTLSVRGLSHGQYTAEGEAHCEVNGFHAAPDLDCSCGFWALKNKEEAIALAKSCFASLLEVDLYGVVNEYSRGYRASHQRVLSVLAPEPGCSYSGVYNDRETECAGSALFELADSTRLCANHALRQPHRFFNAEFPVPPKCEVEYSFYRSTQVSSSAPAGSGWPVGLPRGPRRNP